MKRDVLALIVGAAAVAAASTICVAAPASTAVVLEAKDEGGMNVGGARATIDGAQVIDKLDGAAIPVSPGTHRVVFAAAGFRSIGTTFVVAEGQRPRVIVFLTATSSELTVSASELGDEPASVGSRQRNLALGLVGVGLGGVAIGAVWSLKSKSTYDDALSSECGGDPNHCSAQGIADGKTAHRQADIATVGFVAGGLMLAAGATLYFTRPKQTGVSVAPGIDGGGSVMVAGRW
jgi:hypothetical protein